MTQDPLTAKASRNSPGLWDELHKSCPDKSLWSLFPEGTFKTKPLLLPTSPSDQAHLGAASRGGSASHQQPRTAPARSPCRGRAFPGSGPALDSMFCSAARSNLALSCSSNDPRSLLGTSAMRGGDTPIKLPSVIVPSFPPHAGVHTLRHAGSVAAPLCLALCWVQGIKDEAGGFEVAPLG